MLVNLVIGQTPGNPCYLDERLPKLECNCLGRLIKFMNLEDKTRDESHTVNYHHKQSHNHIFALVTPSLGSYLLRIVVKWFHGAIIISQYSIAVVFLSSIM